MKQILIAAAVALTMGSSIADTDTIRDYGKGTIIYSESLANDYTGRAYLDDDMGGMMWLSKSELSSDVSDDVVYELATKVSGKSMFSNKYMMVDDIENYLDKGTLVDLDADGDASPYDQVGVIIMGRVMDKDGHTAGFFANDYVMVPSSEKFAFEQYLAFEDMDVDYEESGYEILESDYAAFKASMFGK